MTNYYMIKCFIIIWPIIIIIIIIIKNDISWNLNVVISRGRVEPAFRDDEHIVVIVNNRLLDQVELFEEAIDWTLNWAIVTLAFLLVFFLKNWEAQGSILGRGLAEKQGKMCRPNCSSKRGRALALFTLT